MFIDVIAKKFSVVKPKKMFLYKLCCKFLPVLCRILARDEHRTGCTVGPACCAANCKDVK
jgi:hypothetical protein